jgi:UDP-N-acetylglucosamine 2-epimerase (non-hydrolysing)
MKISVIFGTRPEIIKLSPVIRALQQKKLNFFIIHTNQHYNKNMDEIFLKELALPKAKYNLNIGSGTHGNMTGRMLIEVEKIFFKEKPDLLIVQGDTNTVLAVSLAASKLGIKIAHVEAGLRSYTKIPEETNRILTDRISDFLFAPTEKQNKILQNEGIEKEKIFVVGNTIVDAVIQNLKLASHFKSRTGFETRAFESAALKPIKPKKYLLATAHREENVDNKTKLENILNAIEKSAKKHNLKAIYPIHPRTEKRIKEFKIKKPKNIKFIKPVGYLDMLLLMKNAKIILTDSGGIQEEACILHVPCVTMREATERPETVEVGGNIIAGTDAQKIIKCVDLMLKKKVNWNTPLSGAKSLFSSPFGSGNSGKLIMEILKMSLT